MLTMSELTSEDFDLFTWIIPRPSPRLPGRGFNYRPRGIVRLGRDENPRLDLERDVETEAWHDVVPGLRGVTIGD